MSGADELRGQVVGECLLERVLARGGMSVTWQAHHQKLDLPVVVKVLDPARAWGRPALVESFLREARALGAIHHPHVVRVFSAGAENKVPYLVLELVQGGSLRARLRDGMDPGEALRLVEQAALGLGAAHAHGIVHGDVKPENVLVTLDGEAKIADFGLAQATSDAVAAGAGRTVHGTPAYMSPEQCRGEALDARADVYALGVMAFEVLVDRWPFNAPDPRRLLQKHLEEDPPLADLREADVPDAVARVIGRCLAKDREDRPADGTAVAEALREAEAAAPGGGKKRRKRGRGGKGARRGGSSTGLAIGLVIAAAAIVLGVLLLTSR